jgi:hypothetical protein
MAHLDITTGAGFFSCSTEALLNLVIYSSINGRIPDSIDRSKQYEYHKSNSITDLIPYYFEESAEPFDVPQGVQINSDGKYSQFCDYRTIQFDTMKSYLLKYFQPSKRVKDRESKFIKQYQISPTNTCAIFYRGNDKARETPIASYSEFISQAAAVKADNPNIEFLVQTDEAEFLELFLSKFPDAKYISEIPRISKQDNLVTHVIDRDSRPEFGVDFFSSVLILAKCKSLITHSGNCGFWSVLYRGSFDGVRQWQNDHWII